MGASIPEELKKRLIDAVVHVSKEGEAATQGSQAALVDAIVGVVQAIVPAEGPPSNPLTLTELHEEIKWQGDEFNQIDSKTGITLGFVLIFAGQLLTLFTAKRADIAPFLAALNHFPWVGYSILYGFIIVIASALACGVRSRWPQNFRGSAINPSNTEKDATGKISLKKDTLSENKIREDLYTAVSENRSIIALKSYWSKRCGLFAALSLLGVVLLIGGSIFYQQSIVADDSGAVPSDRKSAPCVAGRFSCQ